GADITGAPDTGEFSALWAWLNEVNGIDGMDLHVVGVRIVLFAVSTHPMAVEREESGDSHAGPGRRILVEYPDGKGAGRKPVYLAVDRRPVEQDAVRAVFHPARQEGQDLTGAAQKADFLSCRPAIHDDFTGMEVVVRGVKLCPDM